MKKKGLKFKKPGFMLFVLLIATIAFGANVWAAEVDSTDPEAGATGVSVNTNVTVTFYTDMDSTTINADTFFVTTGSAYDLTTIVGTITYSETVATFSPANALENNTTYKATVTTGAEDADGVPLATDYTWSFTTAGSPASLISSTVPADGSAGVDVNELVVANFAQEMNSSTINGSTFYVAVGTGYSAVTVAGSVSYADMKATFTPNSPLDYNTTYTATVTSDVKDANGTSLGSDFLWSFTIKEQGGGSTYPEISSVNPGDGATGISVSTTVAVTFSEAMNSSTLEEAFSLKAGSGYGLSNVVVTMSYNAANKTATFTPATVLYNTTAYTAMVTTSAKSAAGYAVEADYSWSFITSDEGVTYPTVTSFSPGNEATDVDVNAVIKVEFSREMNPSTLNEDTFYVGTGTGYDLQTVAGTVTYSGVTATFTPSVPLDSETAYSAVVTTDAEDVDGNSIESDRLWSFTTGEEEGDHPTVTSVKVIETELTVTFSAEMDPSSVEESFMVKAIIPGVGYGIVAGEFKYDEDTATATFMPYSEFIPEADYEVTITGAMDNEGNYLKFDVFSYTGPTNNIDNDNDGFTENENDCNDADDSIFPGADEILNDGIDQDCDGRDDAGFALADFVTNEALAARLEELQEISMAHADTGYRLSGTAGYDAGIDYVKEGLEAVGYVFTEQPVEFRFFEELEDPVFGQVSPNQVAYALDDDFSTQTYSGSGDVTAEIAFVTPIIPMDPEADPSTSTDGCEVEDFEGIDLTGKIAVIQRGDCYYGDKAKNAEDAGAIGAIIFNEGQTGRQDQMGGTLGNESEISIPVIATSYQIGAALYDLAQTGSVEIHMTVTTSDETRTSDNIITETPGGNSEQVIMIGAHMDGVSPAPATNDNGSGIIAVFELAYQMAQQGFNPVNKVRFAWWSVEEQGKVGSGAYLDSLSEDERAKIGMYLNFDMLGSNNYAILVYDGDVSDTAEDPNNSSDMSDSVLRPESGAIEQVFLDYFASEDLTAFPQALSGRSDYYDFVLYGIPFGGAWGGADVLKTEEQAAVYGGTVGEQYDTCYHKLCDDMENLNMDAMTSISKSAAHATQYFAQDVKLFDDLPPPPAPGPRRAAYKEDRVKTKDRVFKYDRHHSDRHLYSVK